MFKRRRSKAGSSGGGAANHHAVHSSGGTAGAGSGSDVSSNGSSLFLRSCLKQVDNDNSTRSQLSNASSRASTEEEVGGDRTVTGTRRTSHDASSSSPPHNNNNNNNNNNKETASRESSEAATSNSNSRRSHKRKPGVRFHSIHIREFERVIGDNPSCSSGAPISIGWAHGNERVMKLDDFEVARPHRRSQPELVLTRQDREELLVEWGVTFHEIIDSIRANVRAKNQRRRTVNSIGTYDRWEEAMETASRKLKRTLLLQKPLRQRAQDLQEQTELFAKVHGQPVTYVAHPVVEVHSDDDLISSSDPKEGGSESGRLSLEVDLDDHIVHTQRTPPAGLHVSSGSLEYSQRTADPNRSFLYMPRTGVSGQITEPDSSTSPRLQSELPPPFGTDLGNGGRVPPIESLSPEGQRQMQLMQIMECEGPILEVGFAVNRDNDQYYNDDVSTWCLTVDEYEEVSSSYNNYYYGGGGNGDDPHEPSQHSGWDLEGMGGPAIQSHMVPVVISEDGPYDNYFLEDTGFTMQPPPYSNAIISKWE